jgi:hypothetical protein
VCDFCSPFISNFQIVDRQPEDWQPGEGLQGKLLILFLFFCVGMCKEKIEIEIIEKNQ